MICLKTYVSMTLNQIKEVMAMVAYGELLPEKRAVILGNCLSTGNRSYSLIKFKQGK